MIELRGLEKTFQGKRTVTALKGVDLAIGRGELLSIIGPSGSGKSTLLNLIGGLDRPTAGELLIEGTRVSELSDDGLTRLRRETIGIIFQFFHLLPSLNCVENVALPLNLRGWPRKKAARRAEEVLQLVGLSGRLSHLPDELSGGERQRVAIARALASEPPILLGDEPTGNLDSATGREILGLIHEIHRKLGTTILLVTHDLEVAASCPRIVTLRDGRIVKDERQ